MRAVIQRVSHASVTVSGKVVGNIQNGLLVLLGIEVGDGEEDIIWLSKKIIDLRIFNDMHGIMNRSVKESKGDVLLISQFTLHASTKRGRRPSYTRAANPRIAVLLYEAMINQLGMDFERPVQTGIFGADMKVELLNDGPVTILIDSKNRE